MVNGLFSEFLFQMEKFSGITKYGRFMHLACLIVGFCGGLLQILWETGAIKPRQIEDGC